MSLVHISYVLVYRIVVILWLILIFMMLMDCNVILPYIDKS
jgi:hypothetical protein